MKKGRKERTIFGLARHITQTYLLDTDEGITLEALETQDEDDDDEDEFAGNVAHFCCTLFNAVTLPPPPDPLLLFELLTFIELILLADSL